MNVAQAQIAVVNYEGVGACLFMLAGMNEARIASIVRRAKGHPAARNYRVLALDAMGEIIAAGVFPAEDDAAAIVIARLMESSADRELWEAERLISRLPADSSAK